LGRSASTKMSMRYEQQLKAAEEHQSHGLDHLCFMYWQLTGGNIEANTQGPTGPHEMLDQFIWDLWKKGPDSKLPNVISHDFVSEETCSKIIKLNNPDRAQMIREFALKFATR